LKEYPEKQRTPEDRKAMDLENDIKDEKIIKK
jgi:hypothetical protein